MFYLRHSYNSTENVRNDYNVMKNNYIYKPLIRVLSQTHHSKYTVFIVIPRTLHFERENC